MLNKFDVKKFKKDGILCIPFWQEDKANGVFSPWHQTDFYYRAIKFINISQWMAYKKADRAGDRDTRDKILLAKEPAAIKRLESIIQNHDNEVWKYHEYQELIEGNYLKFKQNDKERYALYETSGGLILYASPYDKNWGMGMSDKDLQSANITEICQILKAGDIKGGSDNKLGKALMEVRHRLKHENFIDTIY